MIEKAFIAFGAPDAIVGDLVEQRSRRSRIWFWRQSVAAIGVAVGRAVVMEPWAAVRAIGVGNGVLFIGAWLSLRLYLWATLAVPFPHSWIMNPYFVLAWHSYSLPLNALWCVTATASGWLAVRADKQRRLAFAVLTIAAQVPVLIWFAWPAIQATLRLTRPPILLRYHVAFAVDVLIVLFVMPACAVAAALKGCATVPDVR